MASFIWNYLGYIEEEPKPTSKTLRARKELLIQINKSKIKLKSVYTTKRANQFSPVLYKRKLEK